MYQQRRKKQFSNLRLLQVIAVAGVLLIAVQWVQAKTEKVLHSFTGGTDGANPYAGVVLDKKGNLYGMTPLGGSSYSGTVFKVSPTGTETVLYTFTGGTDGANPYGGLVLDQNGNLYGTTSGGGASGLGTVFQLTPTGTETVLHSFSGGSDGANPYGSLIFDTQGYLCGTTYYGGTSNLGTVFKMTVSGSETLLYSFTGADGAHPLAGVVVDAQNNLYGTTFGGGIGGGGNGAVFEVSSSGAETVLYSFTGSPDGAQPKAGLILDAQGNLYGTTANGGNSVFGTVFKVTPSGTETVLYSFTGGGDGSHPDAGLVLDALGNLYGTTSGGGSSNNGTVFRVVPSGAETVLYSFAGIPDGAYPEGGLALKGKKQLYGITYYGGTFNQGSAFKIAIPSKALGFVDKGFD